MKVAVKDHTVCLRVRRANALYTSNSSPSAPPPTLLPLHTSTLDTKSQHFGTVLLYLLILLLLPLYLYPRLP